MHVIPKGSCNENCKKENSLLIRGYCGVRFEVFTAYCEECRLLDIKTHFVLHRRHISLRYNAQLVNAM
jgi:hypothetical protein